MILFNETDTTEVRKVQSIEKRRKHYTTHLSSDGGAGAPHTHTYPVVVGGVGVLVTGDDLRCHPVGSADEGVPPAYGPVQLSTHAKIH